MDTSKTPAPLPKLTSLTPRLTRCPAVPSKTTKAILFGEPIVTASLSPSAILPVNSTSATVRGDGGMKKSSLLMTVPNGVLTAMRPDPVPGGTSVSMVMVVEELRIPSTRLKVALLLASVASTCVPVIVTAAPGATMAGPKAAMAGTSGAAVTVKRVALVAEPVGVVMVIGPVTAPDGTVTTISVAVTEATVAGMPLNVTVFSPGVLLNPVPCTVIDVPTGALSGVNSMIETTEDLHRSL